VNSGQDQKPAIIFDLGGVLIDWNPRYLYRKLFSGNEDAMERFLAEVCTPEWNHKQDAGRPFAEATEELLHKHPDLETPIRAWFGRYPEMLAGAIEPAVAALSELKKGGYPLFALSNWSAETFPYALERFEFLEWFKDIMISGAVKLAKPDPRIFELLLKRIERNAEECVYIDDTEINVTAARQLGFRAIHFQSADSLRDELVHMIG
jgi:2-haloacid dehalogenase